MSFCDAQPQARPSSNGSSSQAAGGSVGSSGSGAASPDATTGAFPDAAPTLQEQQQQRGRQQQGGGRSGSAAPQPSASKPYPQAAGDVLLELRGVFKSFGNKDILRGASMQIRRGEAVGIIGESSSLAHMQSLASLRQADLSSPSLRAQSLYWD